MKTHRALFGWSASLLLGVALRAQPPATPPVASAAAVELPPMLVEESTASVPWLYVHAGGTEFLSRCSAGTTRDLVEGWLAKMQLVGVLVPAEFLARLDVPSVFILYAQDLETTMSAEIQRELQAGPREGGRVQIASSMRLTDRDMHASIAYIDEALFDGANLSIASGHVRYLLRGRVPELPSWLVDGIERAWRRTDFVQEPITFRPFIWLNQNESDLLAGDATHPRALLPANELFATDAARTRDARHARRAEARNATQELFCRWALVSGPATREAFWKFVARSAEEPMSEELFEACFGFDFAELRDRLSDYLPKAVTESKLLEPGKLADLPPIDVRRATPNEIARVRGEWERLAIGHVQHRLPQVREPYIVQARRTLRRAYDTGDRDPRLLATLGLCEVDAGNDTGAREFLEPAVAGGVVRPRAYYELARLRFAALRNGASAERRFSFTEIAPVLQALQGTLRQAPLLPEAFELLGEVWARCESPPNTAEFAELATGVRLFGRKANVALALGQAFARHDRRAEALAALDACTESTAEEPVRNGVLRLRRELSGGTSGGEP